MRCDQIIGLNEWAQTYLRGHSPTVKVSTTVEWPNGRIEHCEREEVRLDSKIVGTYSGFDDYDLHAYTLTTGEVVTEYVQANPWSSGPCFFLALMRENGNPIPASLWSDEDIANA